MPLQRPCATYTYLNRGAPRCYTLPTLTSHYTHAARQRVLHAARRLGVEPQLRLLQRQLESQAIRRNRKDDTNLRLLLAATLAPDASCIDVGANIGDTLRSICSVAPYGKHIAYEPLPELCRALRLEFPSVDVQQMALSNDVGEADFVRVKAIPSRSGLRRPDFPVAETETIRTRLGKLDSLLDSNFAPALIKIDVEGAERQVLEGASETITRHQPIIIFEHDSRWAAHYDTTPFDIYRLLSVDLQFGIYDMDGVGPYLRDQFSDIVFKRKRWNFFARSTSRQRPASIRSD